jgi:hypothetical protein
MSAVLERRNADGVLLRYFPDTRLHVEQKAQPSDRLRVSILRARREIRILRIIAEHLEISDVGLSRMDDALKSIDAALSLARDELLVA